MLRQCLRICFAYSAQPALPKLVTFEYKNTIYNEHFRFINLWSSLYCALKLKEPSSIKLIDLLTRELGVSSEHCEEVLNDEDKHFVKNLKGKHLLKNLEICKTFNVNNEMILNNLKILNLDSETLHRKLKLIEGFDLKDINDGIPLISLSIPQLYRLLNNNNKPHSLKHRLYGMAEKFNKSACEVAQSIVNREFVYKVNFDYLLTVLDELLACGMSADNIMNDWWVIRYKPEVIRERLALAKKSGTKKLMPWMVKCTEQVFQRSIDIKSNELSELQGGEKSMKTYIAEKLECSPIAVEEMCRTFPRLLNVRVIKFKEVHEFLIGQGFSNVDIVNAPKVFAHSLATISSRLGQLNSIGMRVTNLTNLCKSTKAFNQFLRRIQKQRRIES